MGEPKPMDEPNPHFARRQMASNVDTKPSDGIGEVLPTASSGEGSSDLSRSVARFQSVIGRSGAVATPVAAAECDATSLAASEAHALGEASPPPAIPKAGDLFQQLLPDNLAQAEAPPVQPECPENIVENPRGTIGPRPKIKKAPIVTAVAPLFAVCIILSAIAWMSYRETKKTIADLSSLLSTSPIATPQPTTNPIPPDADLPRVLQQLESLRADTARLRHDMDDLKRSVEQLGTARRENLDELAKGSETSKTNGSSMRSASTQPRKPTRVPR